MQPRLPSWRMETGGSRVAAKYRRCERTMARCGNGEELEARRKAHAVNEVSGEGGEWAALAEDLGEVHGRRSSVYVRGWKRWLLW